MAEMTDGDLVEIINKAIEIAVSEAVYKAAKDAGERAEKAVRGAVGQIVTSVLTEYDVRRDGKDFVIRVRQG